MQTKFNKVELSENLCLYQKLHDPKKEKSGTPMLWVDLTFECDGILWVNFFCCCLFV